jgi:hypothetical protein
MKSEIDRPSFWDIRRCLLSPIDFAENLALSQPKHADAVSRFSQELLRLKKELTLLFEKEIVPTPLHDIVNGLIGARGMAEMMSERHPELRAPLERFVRGLIEAQKKFIREVRPDLQPQA